MSLDAVIAAVEQILKSVPSIGSVHPYIRFSNSEAKFKSLFVDPESKKVKAWSITRETTSSIDKEIHVSHDTHAIVIRGWMSVEDDVNSEKEFQGLIESVRNTFNPKRTLDGAVQWSNKIQVRSVITGALGAAIVHYCELTLAVEEFGENY